MVGTGLRRRAPRRPGHRRVLQAPRAIRLGIGYGDRCTADIVWDGGFSERQTVDRRNFFHADEVGTTVTIGEHAGARGGGVTYSRPDVPHRPPAVMLAVPALFLLAAFSFAVRDGARRSTRRGS
jgi:hypothetical protein